MTIFPGVNGLTVGVLVGVGVRVTVGVIVRVGVHVMVGVLVGVGVEGMHNPSPPQDARNTTAQPPQVPTMGTEQKPVH